MEDDDSHWWVKGYTCAGFELDFENVGLCQVGKQPNIHYFN